MLYITVEKWLDFDIPTITAILYSEEYSDRDSLVKEFIAKERLTGCSYDKGHVGNLQYVKSNKYDFAWSSALSKLADEFISFLKSKGFKELKTQNVSFSD